MQMENVNQYLLIAKKDQIDWGTSNGLNTRKELNNQWDKLNQEEKQYIFDLPRVNGGNYGIFKIDFSKIDDNR